MRIAGLRGYEPIQREHNLQIALKPALNMTAY